MLLWPVGGRPSRQPGCFKADAEIIVGSEIVWQLRDRRAGACKRYEELHGAVPMARSVKSTTRHLPSPSGAADMPK